MRERLDELKTVAMVDKYKEEDDDDEHFLEDDFSIIGMFDDYGGRQQQRMGKAKRRRNDVQRASATDNLQQLVRVYTTSSSFVSTTSVTCDKSRGLRLCQLLDQLESSSRTDAAVSSRDPGLSSRSGIRQSRNVTGVVKHEF